MTLPSYDVEFTKDGEVYQQEQRRALLAGVKGATDLLVLSHGWNNDKRDAAGLYAALLGNFEKVLAVTKPGDTRQFIVLRVYWPSKKFANEELIPGGGAAALAAAKDPALDRMLDALARDPHTLPAAVDVANDSAAASERQELVDIAKTLDFASTESRKRYVELLRSLVSIEHGTDEEDGTREFFNADPEALFTSLCEPIPLPLGTSEGGAANLGDGGAAGLGDIFSGIGASARRLANLATYYQMKARAGLVGSRGLASVLAAVRAQFPELKLHLVGHSFGARVVTAAGHEFPPNTNGVTLALLQGAYSHNGLAKDYVPGKDGYFRRLLSERRISGPVFITHTKNDAAVGIAYPIASRIAGQVAASLGDANDPYGGMGRNGAQHTPEVDASVTLLGEYDFDYSFSQGHVYNLKSDPYISGHSAITGQQVAGALVALTSSI